MISFYCRRVARKEYLSPIPHGPYFPDDDGSSLGDSGSTAAQDALVPLQLQARAPGTKARNLMDQLQSIKLLKGR